MCKKLDKFKIIFDDLNESLKADQSIQLDWHYFKEVFKQKDNIKHVIIGESPYPDNASGIPFIKKNWEKNCSVGKAGDKVLQRLGIKLPSNCNKLPTLNFALKTLLQKKGIVFLNASYFKKERGDYIEIDKINESSKLNTAILKNFLHSDSIKFITIGTVAHKIFCQIYTQLVLQKNYQAKYHSASSKSSQKIMLSQ